MGFGKTRYATPATLAPTPAYVMGGPIVPYGYFGQTKQQNTGVPRKTPPIPGSNVPPVPPQYQQGQGGGGNGGNQQPVPVAVTTSWPWWLIFPAVIGTATVVIVACGK